jgi:hypothetical protein
MEQDLAGVKLLSKYRRAQIFNLSLTKYLDVNDIIGV